MRYLHVALLLLALAPLACADVARGEIDHLRDYLRNSSCRFVRNGTEFDGAQAVAHIDRKAGNAGARIHTAEDWIDYAASRSSSSGKAYHVRCGGVDVESGPWLRDELKRWRAQAPSRTSADPH